MKLCLSDMFPSVSALQSAVLALLSCGSICGVKVIQLWLMLSAESVSLNN